MRDSTSYAYSFEELARGEFFICGQDGVYLEEAPSCRNCFSSRIRAASGSH